MPSSYLFLSSAQRDGYKWNNLPTLSQSTRECYLTVINCKVILTNNNNHDNVNVKLKIPSLNYFSSDNQDVAVAFLGQGQTNTHYLLLHENEISILTNDNLKTLEFALEDNTANAISTANVSSFEAMLKLDYIDQQAMANQVLLEYPKHLK